MAEAIHTWLLENMLPIVLLECTDLMVYSVSLYGDIVGQVTFLQQN